ncbi:hypothetical protein OG552_06145 [Streptomyces sp. NBC_01476]|uniref:hypothetical protein n=1 Tax=Streptomyces sp. NBC_01476 TaxID=2903881 RepID=UPI00324B3644
MRPRQIDFVRFVNGVLEQMRHDGSLLKLERKWPEDGSDGALFAPPPAEYRD